MIKKTHTDKIILLLQEYDNWIRLAVQLESPVTCESKCAKLMSEAINKGFLLSNTNN